MEQLDEESILIRRYLLGELGEEARARLEERILLDQDYKDGVLAVEDALIEDYLDGALPERDRLKFEERFLSTPLARWNVNLSQALTEYAAGHRPTHTAPKQSEEPASAPVAQTQRAASRAWWPGSILNFRWLVGVGAAALVLLTLAVAWRFFGPGYRAGIEMELSRLNRQPRAATESGVAHGRNPPSVVSVVLEPPDSTRGANGRQPNAPQELPAPSDDTIVNFRFQLLKAEATSYEVVFQDGEGNELFSLSDLKADDNGAAPAVSLLVPSKYLSGGEGKVLLKARNADGRYELLYDYPFRVPKR